MGYKEHKSKQAVIGYGSIATKETGKASLSVGPQLLMGSKHDLPRDADEATASDRSKKRRKPNSNTGLDTHEPVSSATPDATKIDRVGCSELAPTARDLPPEVRHLSSKYDFTTMSIISSAKINDKVKKLLLRVEEFNFADPKSKPGIVVLHATSKVASKMVSIIGIARQTIEHNKGKWWQYSKLDGHIVEMKPKVAKRMGDGKTISEWQREREGQESQGIEEAEAETGRGSEGVEHNQLVVDVDEGMEDGFESMVGSEEADQGAKLFGKEDGRKIRATPVMTIYFARVPVPGLKELYGYVVNDFIDAEY